MKSREALRHCLYLTAALVVVARISAQPDTSREIQLHYERAQRALRAGQFQTAESEFREILRLDPKKPEAYANLGVIAYRQKQYPEAIQEFSAALRLNPSLWDAQAFLGLSEMRAGQTQRVAGLLERSFPHIQNRDLRIEAGLELIRIHQQSNALERAIDVVRDLSRLDPKSPAVLYVAYRIYSDLAAHSVTSLAKYAPDSAQMHQVLAEAAETQDDSPGAIAEYRKVLQTDPGFPGIHYELGRAILASSQDETTRQAAQKEFEAELAVNPNDANSEFELGEVYARRSDFRLAAEHYTRALQLRSDLVDAHLGLAKVLASMGKPNDAFPHLLEAERLDPDNEVAHYRLAQAYRQSGQNQDAARELKVVEALRKSHLPARSISGQNHAAEPTERDQ
jgi:tetratricopeptide (TPR) repeat protein